MQTNSRLFKTFAMDFPVRRLLSPLAIFLRNEPLTNPFPGKIPALDGVRGIAILVVMLNHFVLSAFIPDTPFWKLVNSGWLGVDLFFVLSGFLITGILLDTKHRERYWATFFSRRALRIFPLYYFAVLMVWLEVVFIHCLVLYLGYFSRGYHLGLLVSLELLL